MKNEIVERKWHTEYWIKSKLKRAVKCAKDKKTFCAVRYICELRGMLLYMQSVGDITKEEDDKIYKLTELIIKKYELY